ncbi:MAG: hypothetical protein N3J91_09230 [Verrucomicrobiae bacterium]|nr:hypothetical protein [Verrucomicrobiae bacterium]
MDETDTLQNGNPDTWARETWRSLLNMATRAVDNLTTRVQPQQQEAPRQTESWWSKLDTKQVVILVIGGVLALFLVKKLMD